MSPSPFGRWSVMVDPGRTPDRRTVLRSVGPGAMVAAAFIGPGTVTTATLAGSSFGTTLLWALTFSVIATVTLQEMAARLGLVTGAGLGEAVRSQFPSGLRRLFAVLLVISAIAFGNAAYETGNLLGAALGVNGMVGGEPRFIALAVAAVAAALLWTGRYKVIERVLVAMVVVMSALFLITAFLLGPDLRDIATGIFIPVLPADPAALLTAVGLIGTTVVPYNLFLHAAAVSEKWPGPEWLPAARLDLTIAIVLGGIVSMAIVVTSATALAGSGTTVATAADMAVQLEPILGTWARASFAAGLLAAGLTSAITAPLAAAWATAGALGWKRDLRDPRLRAVWALVIGAGALFAGIGVRPVPAILFAQVANGLLLPFIAIFLLLAVNDRRRMGGRKNGIFANAVGVLVVLVAAGLGGLAVWRAVG